MLYTYADLVLWERKPLEQIIRLVQELGLFSRGYKCPRCGVPMYVAPRADINDKNVWRCPIACCRKLRSLRSGTWFSRSDLPLMTILKLTYMWTLKYPQKIIAHELNITAAAIVRWLQFCRESCVQIVLKSSTRIGGEGKIVIFHEYVFEPKRRRQTRRNRVERSWAYVGFEQNSGKCFLKVVKDRLPETLVSLLKELIAAGTTIVSSKWKAHDALNPEGYEKLTREHSIRFSDYPENKNAAEGLWLSVKKMFPKFRLKLKTFDARMGQYMYFKMQPPGVDMFEQFVRDAATIYPPFTEDPATGPPPPHIFEEDSETSLEGNPEMQINIYKNPMIDRPAIQVTIENPEESPQWVHFEIQRVAIDAPLAKKTKIETDPGGSSLAK